MYIYYMCIYIYIYIYSELPSDLQSLDTHDTDVQFSSSGCKLLQPTVVNWTISRSLFKWKQTFDLSIVIHILDNSMS